MSKQRIVCLVAFILGIASATNYYHDLENKFKTQDTSAYLRENVIGSELESAVKGIYREFLKGASLAQKDRIGTYFSDWKKVVDVNGPFENKKKQDAAFKAIVNPSDFSASLYIEQLLENRDDSEETIEIFKKAMISPDSMKLQLYFTGDGDIINGVVAASLKNNGDLYVVTSLFD